MPSEKTRSDSLREFLTGASSDGGAQADIANSRGNFRSSTEAASLAITIANALSGVTILFAGGANAVGQGILTATDSSNLTWQPYGGSAGAAVSFSGTQTKIVEALNQPGQFLRITGTTPFTPGASQITLTRVHSNIFGNEDVTVAEAGAGYTKYRATIIRNEAAGSVTNFKRWIGQLATQQVSGAGLGGSGSGTINTSGTFTGWPEAGWCQVRTSGGVLKEVVYYTSRTQSELTVPAAGRALLATSATAGTVGDLLHSVPGIAIAKDPDGAEAHGSSIQTIAAGLLTAPTGVTWSFGLDAAGGLSFGTLATAQQHGCWFRRHIPAGCKADALALTVVNDSFDA